MKSGNLRPKGVRHNYSRPRLYDIQAERTQTRRGCSSGSLAVLGGPATITILTIFYKYSQRKETTHFLVRLWLWYASGCSPGISGCAGVGLPGHWTSHGPRGDGWGAPHGQEPEAGPKGTAPEFNEEAAGEPSTHGTRTRQMPASDFLQRNSSCSGSVA